MKKETIEFIEGLFEAYKQSSSGQEPENAEALNKAWDDLETCKARSLRSERTLDLLYAEIRKDPYVGMWEMGARLVEILTVSR